MQSKTVAEKLLIKPDTNFWSSPASSAQIVGPLPDTVHRVDRPELAVVALVVADDAASLRTILAAHEGQWTAPDKLWVAYPKGNRSDINRDTVWPILTEHGVRPNGQVSLDDTWSALRFRANRPGEPPFTGGR
ncbi:MAG TPA: hypothetical protein VFQ15_06340 [Jiangellaceae bacterium]|jgi:hypothetical protein|nr:hypothetical protein [Jiangellaceae bacterium]